MTGNHRARFELRSDHFRGVASSPVTPWHANWNLCLIYVYLFPSKMIKYGATSLIHMKLQFVIKHHSWQIVS